MYVCAVAVLKSFSFLWTKYTYWRDRNGPQRAGKCRSLGDRSIHSSRAHTALASAFAQRFFFEVWNVVTTAAVYTTCRYM